MARNLSHDQMKEVGSKTSEFGRKSNRTRGVDVLFVARGGFFFVKKDFCRDSTKKKKTKATPPQAVDRILTSSALDKMLGRLRSLLTFNFD